MEIIARIRSWFARRQQTLPVPEPLQSQPSKFHTQLTSVVRPARHLTPLIHEVAVQICASPEYGPLRLAAVPSAREEGVTYACDLHLMTCTCPDFQKKRFWLPHGTLGRMCKHLRQVAVERGNLALPNTEFEEILADTKGRKVFCGHLAAGDPVFFAIDFDSEWIDVFVKVSKKGDQLGRHSGPYKRHGWSPVRSDWAGGERPRGAKELQPLIRDAALALENFAGEVPFEVTQRLLAEHERAVHAYEVARREAQLAGTPCFVCGTRLSVPMPPDPDTLVDCELCGIRNVVTKSGRANRPERIAVYQKYDGDLYSKQGGLIPAMRHTYEQERERIRAERNNGHITTKEYQALLRKLRSRESKEEALLEEQKSQEIRGLAEQEHAARARASKKK